MSEQISREDLLQFTHQLHCKLRGAKGIKLTGLPALNDIENILFFRFIEERKEIKLDDDIKFSAICKKYATDEKIKEDKKIPILKDRNCFKLWDEFYNTENENCIIGKYFSNEVIHKYISSSVSRVSAFTDKNRSAISATIQEMFNMVYNKFNNIKFDSSFYDMFGAAHEEFKTNAHGNDGKHTGQHFTPMEIKRLVSEELKVKSIEIYYEPCAGTGGFIHTIDKYVRDNEGEKASKKFKKNIYANECNPEITKPLMINMLLHDIPVDNIHERDSLSNENCELMKEIADAIGTNYPFGMSNKIELSDYTDKDYWGCLVRNKNVIKNSTGQFIMHIYHSLKKNGRAGFVSDRGILNNGDDSSWEKDIRKFIIKNTNLYKIWLLPNGVFPYTNFATCVIFIRKGEETKNIEIFEGKFKDNKNKSGLYIEEYPVRVFNIKELEKNGYSLKMEEKIEKIKKGWVKLGDVVEFEKGKSLNKDKMIAGNYNVIGGGYGLMDETHNNYNCEENTIIMSNDGAYAGYINKFDKKIFITSHCNKILIKNNTKYIKDYIYYFLKINYQTKLLKKDYDGGFQIGQGTPSIDKDSMFYNIQIPSLSLDHQQEIVDFLDKQFELYDINLLAKQIRDMPLFNLLIDKKYDLFADALHLIYRKLELDALHTKMDKDKKAVFNLYVNGLKCKNYKLGDVLELEFGTRITKGKDSVDENEKIKYPVYGGGDITFYTKDKNRSGKNILISRFGVSPKCVRIINDNIFINDSCMSVKILNKKLCMFDYLGYYLLYNQGKIFKFADGQGQKNMMTNDLLKKFIINLPSLGEQEKIIKEIEKIESTQSTYADYAKSIQIQIDSINKVIENLTQINKDENDESESSESEEKEEVKPKKKVKQTKKESSESESDNYSDNSSEEESKPKKIIKPIKKIELSKDDEQPKKKPKPVKKVKSSSSESDSSSDSSSEDLKPKKKVKQLNKIK